MGRRDSRKPARSWPTHGSNWGRSVRVQLVTMSPETIDLMCCLSKEARYGGAGEGVPSLSHVEQTAIVARARS